MKRLFASAVRFGRGVASYFAVWSGRALFAGLMLLLLLSLGSYCSAPRFENDPSDVAGERYEMGAVGEANDADRLFVCLALSGGGTRAAALSFGALEALRDVEIEWPPQSGRRVPILDEVDVVSAVSGGAFTAAAYGLFGARIFETFRDRVLYRDIAGDIAWRVADPRRWFRLARGDYSRIDAAAELYTDAIFEGRCYADLARRPQIVLGSTNVSTGTRFAFDQSTFDLIGSDLGALPVGVAVAASSAFPMLLSPVTLRVYSPPFDYEFPQDLSRALKAGPYSLNHRRRYELARDLAPYVFAREAHPFVHLLDGGLSDNLGLRHIIDSWIRGDIRRRLNAGAIERLLVIVVNSKAAPEKNYDAAREAPGLLSMGYETATISMDNYTFETVELMADLFSARDQAQRDIAAANARIRVANTRLVAAGLEPVSEFDDLPRSVGLHLVEIALDQIPDEIRRDRLLSVPTRLTLPRESVDELIEAGDELLRAHPGFRSFVESFE